MVNRGQHECKQSTSETEGFEARSSDQLDLVPPRHHRQVDHRGTRPTRRVLVHTRLEVVGTPAQGRRHMSLDRHT